MPLAQWVTGGVGLWQSMLEAVGGLWAALPEVLPDTFVRWHPAPSAPAAGTAASWTPGTRREGFTPTEVWRNSGRVLTSRRLSEERTYGTLLTELAEEEESRPGATQQRSCLRRQDARTALTLNAGDDGREAQTLCVAALPALAYLLPFDTGCVAEAVVSRAIAEDTTAGAGLEY